MIDSNLSWKYHIESICHEISRSIGIIAKIRYYVPRCVLLSVYNSLIGPYLTYGICGWRNCLDISLKDRNSPYPSFSNRIDFPFLAYFSEIVAFLLQDINRQTAPVSILNQFVKKSQIHN